MDTDIFYNAITKEGESEIVVTKSRFIGLIKGISGEEEALSEIARVKKKYHDARHNCWAYVILDGNGCISRSSDDGEPSGTAGKPILSVVEGERLVNAVCIVTRYFGGVLLGTGGLVRVYTDAAKAAVQNANISSIRRGVKISLTFEYADEAPIRRYSESMGYSVSESRYAEKVYFELTGPAEKADEFLLRISDMTGGRTVPVKGEEIYYHA